MRVHVFITEVIRKLIPECNMCPACILSHREKHIKGVERTSDLDFFIILFYGRIGGTPRATFSSFFGFLLATH